MYNSSKTEVDVAKACRRSLKTNVEVAQVCNCRLSLSLKTKVEVAQVCNCRRKRRWRWPKCVTVTENEGGAARV